ncbi:hypothetical protein EDB87DRAFT_1578226 [Lactarius vividus]|nr:hypothetical protein EDB87DRAFT_1578226 [Lactarius vividus]
MLSRFSALLVYVVAGLVISAAATPMGQSADYNDEPKSRPPGAYGPQSYPPHHKYPQDKPYSKPYDHAYKAYGGGEDKPYSKPYPEEKKYPEKKYPRDKKHPEEKPHPEDKDRKSDYDNKDGKSGQCAVEHQHCCDSIDSVTQARARGILTPVLTLIDITGNAHTNCSPYYSTTGGKACTAQTVCCDNAEFARVNVPLNKGGIENWAEPRALGGWIASYSWLSGTSRSVQRPVQVVAHILRPSPGLQGGDVLSIFLQLVESLCMDEVCVWERI